MAKALSDEVAQDGILADAIHPSSTRTQRQMQLVLVRAARGNTV